MEQMPEELIAVLTRFHREVVLPDIKNEVGPLRTEMRAIHSDTVSYFDAIYRHFELKFNIAERQQRVADLEANL